MITTTTAQKSPLQAQYINWYLVRGLPAGATDEFIRNSWFGQQGWRWMFGLTAVPAVLFFLGMSVVPESPRWLANNGKPTLARAILQKIGGENYAIGAVTRPRGISPGHPPVITPSQKLIAPATSGSPPASISTARCDSMSIIFAHAISRLSCCAN